MSITKLSLVSRAQTVLGASILIVGLVASGSTSAASQCKGLDSEACGSSSSCGWVNAYERKDGRKVNGFCRTKAKRTAVKAKKPETQSTS